MNLPSWDDGSRGNPLMAQGHKSLDVIFQVHKGFICNKCWLIIYMFFFFILSLPVGKKCQDLPKFGESVICCRSNWFCATEYADKRRCTSEQRYASIQLGRVGKGLLVSFH